MHWDDTTSDQLLRIEAVLVRVRLNGGNCGEFFVLVDEVLNDCMRVVPHVVKLAEDKGIAEFFSALDVWLQVYSL